MYGPLVYQFLMKPMGAKMLLYTQKAQWLTCFMAPKNKAILLMLQRLPHALVNIEGNYVQSCAIWK